MRLGLGLYLAAQAAGGGGDTTAPTVAITGASDTQFDITSDEAGTCYWLINASVTPLAGATIAAGGGSASGSFAAGAGASSQGIWIAHLATGTWYIHVTVKDAAGNYSTDQVQAFAHTYLGIQYVGGAMAKVGLATNFPLSFATLTGGIDTAPRPHDIAVVYTGIAAGSILTAGIDTGVSSGWTEEANPSGNDARDVRLRNAYKIMGATPDASVTCLAGNNASYSSMALVMFFRGVHQTTPIDVATVPASATNGAAINSNSITPVTAGACVISGGMNTATGTPTDITAGPTGFTNLLTDKQDTGSVDANIAMAIQLGWASGAVDPSAFTGATTDVNDAMAAITMALRPAA